MKFHAESAQYFDDRRETRIAIARKGLVETFAPHARLLCEIGHAFRPRHDAESMGEERRVFQMNAMKQMVVLGNHSAEALNPAAPVLELTAGDPKKPEKE